MTSPLFGPQNPWVLVPRGGFLLCCLRPLPVYPAGEQVSKLERMLHKTQDPRRFIRRVNEVTLLTGIHVSETVCEAVAHRQFVFTLPKRFRRYFLFNRELLRKLPNVAYMARCPLSLDRIVSVNDKGQVVYRAEKAAVHRHSTSLMV